MGIRRSLRVVTFVLVPVIMSLAGCDSKDCGSSSIQIDFACNKTFWCDSETTFHCSETLDCDALYTRCRANPDYDYLCADLTDPDCCGGFTCKHLGVETCPAGQVCVVHEGEGVDDACEAPTAP